MLLLFYLLCFCHLASDSMIEDWLGSSVIAIFIDFVLLEVLTGLLFGVMGSIWGCYKQSKCFWAFIALG